MLNKVKRALQITDDVFDDEIETLLIEAKKDMAFAGIVEKEISAEEMDSAYEQAMVLYCCFRFELFHGSVSKSETLEKIYNEQKRQLGMASGYTDWND